MNRCRSVKISLRMQCIMWYSGKSCDQHVTAGTHALTLTPSHPLGLRGAVAFALAMNLNPYFGKEVTGYIVTTTLVIVLFTIVILGGSTLPLLIVMSCVLLTHSSSLFCCYSCNSSSGLTKVLNLLLVKQKIRSVQLINELWINCD